MARPLKKGLDFFSVDCGFFRCPELRPARGRFGGIYASGIYLYIISEIYENGYYLKFDDVAYEDFILGAADSLGIKEGLVRQVLNFFLKRSLFDNTLFEEEKVLTSHAIQRRYQLAMKSRGTKKEVEVDSKYWLLEKSDTESYIKVTQNSSYSEKNPSYSEKNYSFSEEKHIKEKEKEKEKVKGKGKGKENELSAAVDAYEKNIGTISGTVAERINDWLKDVNVSLIIYAIEQAARYNKRSWSYIESILKSKYSAGVKTREAAESGTPKKAKDAGYELDDLAAMERRMRLERMAGSNEN